MIKNFYKKYKIFIALILLVILIVLLVNLITNNDGMKNKGIYNVKYRVYQNGKWTKYSKNGMTIGDKEHPIQNIEFKYNKEKGLINYFLYTDDWSEQIYGSLESNAKKIYGIKISDSNVLYKKYDICYRTYNKKDKWLNWTCNGEISGNKKEFITAIEIKLIPKNSVKKDYLKNYSNNMRTRKNFQGGLYEREND